MIALAVPQHPGQRLTLHPAGIFVVEPSVNSGVKLIGFADAIGENLLESGEGIGLRSGPDAGVIARSRWPMAGKVEPIKRGGLGAPLLGIHGVLGSFDYIIMKCVFEITLGVAASEDAVYVGFVFAEEKSLWRVEIEMEGAES